MDAPRGPPPASRRDDRHRTGARRRRAARPRPRHAEPRPQPAEPPRRRRRDRYVFATSELFSPNWIGGIKPADDICKQLANKADLPNPFTFTAWLSDSQSNAIDRLYPGQGRYLRPDGVVVALGAQQFTSGTLLAPIQTDEYGEPLVPEGVWTGTGPDGIVVPGADNCSDWTSDSLLENGHLGDNSVMNDRWTFIADPDVNPTSRALSFHLYCIEGK